MTADAVGGVWQYALDLADGLRAHQVEVTLAVLGPAPSEDQQAMAEAIGVKLILTGLPLDWTATRRSEVEEAARIAARIAAQAAPDLIHLNSPALAGGADFPAPVVAVCHSCVATWWQAVRSGPLPDEFTWRTELVRQGYRAADMLIAPTLAFARATADVYELERGPAVVRNGRRGGLVCEPASSEPAAFTAGRLWDDGKNIATIDRAAARLSIPVLAAGPLDGPNGARVHVEHARTLGRLSDEEIRTHLSKRPIFVSAARYEPFGLAVLEAAQAGCALVLSDIPTFRELWDGVAAFVPPDDDEALGNAVEHFASHSELRVQQGLAARERAKSYSVEAMSAGILAAYRSLLQSKIRKSSLEEAAA
ncbi:glycosyltransferase family 4 protein [Microvirga lenta]|uniref:glycosyltransferase family 4 protein n=1 Tax=Microvirga lenta TaxID=2881337 RepID=UPI001CFD6FD8|nr:glycosyltransferase family 4 protein [Microvirga lenta]MCB5173902.1 glycosyltransferase family 4 protein [Microvirga lenta]